MKMIAFKKQKFAVLLLLALFTNRAWSQAIPILNSLPGAQKVIYLDFDGQVVTGTSWNANPNQTITALPSTIASTAMVVVWKRIVEDFVPFDVNVTTDLAVFNAAPSVRRMRVIVTPTSAWYPNAGGVAYLGSFTWGGSPDTPCWVFENQLGYSAKNIAEAASHEIGHTLTLRHQSTWDNNCAKTAEYHGGIGTGVIGWAPIMGVGYSKNVTIWHNGTNSQTCTTIQNDHGTSNPGIRTPNFLAFKTDDVGNTQATAKTLTLNSITVIDSGLISEPTDIDAFKFTICNSRYITFNIQPWALDTNSNSYSGANLDINFKLYDANNNLLINSNPATELRSLSGMSLSPGSYYFTIDGVGSANYTDYGSLGRYYMRIKSSSVPTIISGFYNSAITCQGQLVSFVDASTGNPTTWNWSAPGASPATATVNNPSFTFPNVGTYTVTLTAGGGTNVSCAYTKTINVGAVPSVTASASENSVCAGSTGPATTLALTGSPAGGVFSGTGVSGTVFTAPNISGTYSATYSYTNQVSGCANTAIAQILVMDCTGLSAYEMSSKFLIYPNPNTGLFSIESDSETKYGIEIYNGIGQKIMEQNDLYKQNQIDLSGLGHGIYSVVIKTSTGTAIHKMIVE